jgi:ribosomal protein S12 methylthiotransferase accessory factor
MTSREDQRRVLADALVHEGAPLCRKYGVTRLGDLTHLDSVGIPVWTASRPTSETVTVHSGKSLIHEMARAGAVAEAVEYAAAERPKGPFVVEAASRLRVPHLEPERLPLAFGSLYRAEKPVAWEPCFHANEGRDHWIPSDLVWMHRRAPGPFFDFHMTTNGLGSGVSLEDAALSGLYEVIERDGWTLFLEALEKANRWPLRVRLEGLEGSVGEILDRVHAAGMVVFLFDVTTELGIPTFRAGTYDLGLGTTGAQCGYGCHFDPFVAMERAILEAVQSRACYLAGARDDMFRRGFLFMRQNDQGPDVRFLQSLPEEPAVRERFPVSFGTIESEWDAVLKRLERHGFYDVLVKPLAKEPVGDHTLHTVRVVVPDLEGHRDEMWAPGRRAIEHVQRLLA